MILLYHPKATRPRNRRFPLSVLALAAVLEGRKITPSSMETLKMTGQDAAGAA